MRDGYCFVSAGQSKRTASPFANPLFLCDDSEGVASNKVHTIPFARAKQRIDVLFLAMVNGFNAVFFWGVAAIPTSTTEPCYLWETLMWRTTRTSTAESPRSTDPTGSLSIFAATLAEESAG